VFAGYYLLQVIFVFVFMKTTYLILQRDVEGITNHERCGENMVENKEL
jgi:hypothetical protein